MESISCRRQDRAGGPTRGKQAVNARRILAHFVLVTSPRSSGLTILSRVNQGSRPQASPNGDSYPTGYMGTSRLCCSNVFPSCKWRIPGDWAHRHPWRGVPRCTDVGLEMRLPVIKPMKAKLESLDLSQELLMIKRAYSGARRTGIPTQFGQCFRLNSDSF